MSSLQANSNAVRLTRLMELVQLGCFMSVLKAANLLKAAP